ncbi:hypothetical protein [Nannocystis sp.]|uniref:hypothetical protein n=1 Tax=Nannocystis sp. TaxID=1962667 RepID=UPI0025E6C244|nr:hypothetical protein [Nannocystis sp.]
MRDEQLEDAGVDQRSDGLGGQSALALDRLGVWADELRGGLGPGHEGSVDHVGGW